MFIKFPMPSDMKREVFLDSAKVGNFFEVSIRLLIGEHWKKFAISVRLPTVFGNDTLGDVEQQNICFHTRLLPLGHDPLFIIQGNDVVGRKIGNIDIGQACEAGKEENISDQL